MDPAIANLYTQVDELSALLAAALSAEPPNREYISGIRARRQQIWDEIEGRELPEIAPHPTPPPPDAESDSDPFEMIAPYDSGESGAELIIGDESLQLTTLTSARFEFSLYDDYYRAAIRAASDNRDILLIMPPGSNKSICFHIAGAQCDGTTLVVSPFGGMINQQIRELRALHVPAYAVWPSTSDDRVSQMWQNVTNKALKFIFTISRFKKTSNFFKGLERAIELRQIARVVILDAQGISPWGHDSRRICQMFKFKKLLKNVRITAVTSAATAQVRQDIIERLGIPDCEVIHCVDRPNVVYELREKPATTNQFCDILKSWLKAHNFEKSPGLILCLKKSDVDRLAPALGKAGVACLGYHDGLTRGERSSVQRQWRDKEINVLVCADAFGMRVDRRDLRFVVHYTMPKSIEAYFLECGRAGRDGGPCRCLLLFRPSDKTAVSRKILKGETPNGPNEATTRHDMDRLDRLCEYGMDQVRCRRDLLLEYFGAPVPDGGGCGQCDNCRRGLGSVAVDVTQHARDIAHLVDALAVRTKQTPLPTMRYLKLVYCGANLVSIRNAGDDFLPEFGRGAELKGKREGVIDKIVAVLLDRGVLQERRKGVYHSEVLFYGPLDVDQVDRSFFRPVIVEEASETADELEGGQRKRPAPSPMFHRAPQPGEHRRPRNIEPQLPAKKRPPVAKKQKGMAGFIVEDRNDKEDRRAMKQKRKEKREKKKEKQKGDAQDKPRDKSECRPVKPDKKEARPVPSDLKKSKVVKDEPAPRQPPKGDVKPDVKPDVKKPPPVKPDPA
jgi:RecQ family ATP-dependent DNA helicase